MTKPPEPGQRSNRRLIAAGIAGTAAVLAAVYVIVGPHGNTDDTQSCALEMALAEKTAPFATGEVAAFRPAERPLALSELTFNDPDGNPVSIGDFKDRTILLNLWATWCAPCRKEMPALDELQADMGGEDFQVVAVNVDRGGPEKPKAFWKEIGVSRLDYYSDASNGILKDLKAKARATGLPTTILVGPSGCEIGTMYGPAEWASGEAKALVTAALKTKAD
ncbi:thiol:disulfide interchange protein TlpA [Roseibium sp.]|uniref:thiol:disulfide interchange protein TlpA n=1 Tax=Roseibium sp. TaxID=1936156 RepID=UPI003A96C46F